MSDNDTTGRGGRTPRKTAGAFDIRRLKVMASAAAVPSSSSDALASASPARSATIVWKLSNASRRPWLISGWYGV